MLHAPVPASSLVKLHRSLGRCCALFLRLCERQAASLLGAAAGGRGRARASSHVGKPPAVAFTVNAKAANWPLGCWCARSGLLAHSASACLANSV